MEPTDDDHSEVSGDQPTSTRSAADAIQHIEQRATTLRDEQIDRALTRLREQGELTPEKRVVIAAMADRVTQRLLARPRTGLYRAARADDDTTIQVALDLFGD